MTGHILPLYDMDKGPAKRVQRACFNFMRLAIYFPTAHLSFYILPSGDAQPYHLYQTNDKRHPLTTGL